MAVAVLNSTILCLPLIPGFLAGFRTPAATRQTIFALIPIAGFTAVWVLLSNEMNFLMRFQYAVLPIGLISCPRITAGLKEDWKLPSLSDLEPRKRRAVFLLAGVLAFGLLLTEQETFVDESYGHDSLYDLALILRDYSGKGYSVAITEAGLVPFYSGWTAVDAWGLNDRWIAHHSKISEAYLDKYKPQVIVFHAYFSPVVKPGPKHGLFYTKEWFDTVMTMKSYAEKRKYSLAACYGADPFDTIYLYVRSDFPDSKAIVERLRRLTSYSPDGEQEDFDFASLKARAVTARTAPR
jgi:hypothetical protein